MKQLLIIMCLFLCEIQCFSHSMSQKELETFLKKELVKDVRITKLHLKILLADESEYYVIYMEPNDPSSRPDAPYSLGYGYTFYIDATYNYKDWIIIKTPCCEKTAIDIIDEFDELNSEWSRKNELLMPNWNMIKINGYKFKCGGKYPFLNLDAVSVYYSKIKFRY